MNFEAFLGFNAFSTRKITGEDLIDFVRYRQLMAQGARMGDDFSAEVLGKPRQA